MQYIPHLLIVFVLYCFEKKNLSRLYMLMTSYLKLFKFQIIKIGHQCNNKVAKHLRTNNQTNMNVLSIESHTNSHHL